MTRRISVVVAAVLGVFCLLLWGSGRRPSEHPVSSTSFAGEADLDSRRAQVSHEQPESYKEVPTADTSQAGRKRAELEFLEAERSWQNTLPEAEVRKLASRGDSIAQEIMAVKLLANSPDEALQFALQAANAGRSGATMLAAQIIADQKGDIAEGLLLLDTFQEKNGPNLMIAGYRRSYLAIHQLTQDEIMSDYRLLKSNRELGAPQKYPLTGSSELKAPAHPVPP